MRNRNWIVAGGTAVCLIAGCGDKVETPLEPQAGAPASGPANAADIYRQVHAALGESFLGAVQSREISEAALSEHGADIDRLVDATGLDHCDFGVDWSARSSADLSHLEMARALARVLRADAARLLVAGDADAAAKRVAAILRLAVHMTKEGGSTIELVVGVAIASFGTEFVETNGGLARAAWKTDIQNAIVSVRADGTLNSGACLRADGDSIVRSLRAGTMTEDMTWLGGRNWGAVSQAERDSAAQKLEAINAAAVTAWGSDDALARLRALEARAKQEGVADLFIARDKAREAVDKLNGALAKADATLVK